MMAGEYPSIGELNSSDGERLHSSRLDGEFGSVVVDVGDGPVELEGDGITKVKAEGSNALTSLVANRRVGLRRDRKKMLWQIGDLFANGASSRQIAMHLGLTVSSVDRHLALMHRQWAQEYETNLPSIRGQIDARLRSDEVSIRNQLNELLRMQANEKNSGMKSTFSHRTFMQYQKLLLEVLDRRMALYNVRGELQGEGGVHLHYTLYNFERVVDDKGLPPPIDVKATRLDGRGVVDVGLAPETPGYEDSALESGVGGMSIEGMGRSED